MSTVFDAHGHCFPPLGEDYAGVRKVRLAEHQYHVRFHKQGLRRTRDHERIEEPVLAGERDGISWQPKVDFRIGKFGRVEATHAGEEYYLQWMPPTLSDMSSSPEYMVAQMDYVGVDRAVLQHDRVYGKLDDFLSECVRKYPDRFVALAQVDEWVGGRPDQLERLRHEVQDLGFEGLYFSTGGFFHADFKLELNDPSLEPLWNLVGELGIPVHWYVATLKRNVLETYFYELGEMVQWAKAHPGIPSVLTHGFNNVSIDQTGPDRFTPPADILNLLRLPDWHVELMLHIMNSDAEFPPYNPKLSELVRTLVDEVGAEKLMWGSDMPACERTMAYKHSLVLFQTQCDFLSDDQRAAVLGGNLERLYPKG